jgi:serine phosphatase RsbU (regulator of sigma subunit)
MRDGELQRLITPGMPISTWPWAGDWSSRYVYLPPDGVFFLYTDGLEDALLRGAGSEAELESLVRRAFNGQKLPDEGLADILDAVPQDRHILDDITVMAIKRLSGSDDFHEVR